MRIAYVAAGAAGMYCGTCMHDNTLAAALMKMGHQVALIPTYTPMRTDEPDVSIDKIFYGGINVYLQQKSALFRNTPWFLDRWFDRPALLNWISRFSSSTDAADLGKLTVSVLRGEEGKQRKELEKLVSWLKEYKPEIVFLNNSMFVGFTRQIKKELGVPVLCALQGEDIFLEELKEPYRSEALRLLRERCRDVDGFIATSRYYSEFMSSYLNIPQEKIHIVYLGIHLEGHGESNRTANQNPFVIGYLARICPEKGLHLLAEAFPLVSEKIGSDKPILKAAGYIGAKDQPYLRGILKQLDSWNLKNHFEYVGEVDRKQKIDFLNGLDVLCVPTTYREPKGLFALEAIANGVPVVLPSHGAFPEMIQATGGGILVEPQSPAAIAEGIFQLYQDPSFRKDLGRRGREAVHNRFSDNIMAEATVQVYQRYLP
jgi:glycosyltransferase involved in cell wall biosynthesis